MTAKEIIRRLKQAGFVLKSGKKHYKLVHPDGRITVIPRHLGDITLGVLKSIERQTNTKFGN